MMSYLIVGRSVRTQQRRHEVWGACPGFSRGLLLASMAGDMCIALAWAPRVRRLRCTPVLQNASGTRLRITHLVTSFASMISGSVFSAEGLKHAPSPGKPGDGKLRVIVSKDADSWKSAALLEETGTHLRRIRTFPSPGMAG